MLNVSDYKVPDGVFYNPLVVFPIVFSCYLNLLEYVISFSTFLYLTLHFNFLVPSCLCINFVLFMCVFFFKLQVLVSASCRGKGGGE